MLFKMGLGVKSRDLIKLRRKIFIGGGCFSDLRKYYWIGWIYFKYIHEMELESSLFFFLTSFDSFDDSIKEKIIGNYQIL